MSKEVNNKESLWITMLEEKIESKLDKHCNVLLFGDPSTGKNKLIKNIEDTFSKLLLEQIPYEFEENQDRHNQMVYLMDFKYIQINEKIEGDSTQSLEIGKINFYIFNRVYEFMKDLLNREMIKNILVVIMVDLSKPETIEESFYSWFNFVKSTFQ